MQIRWKIKEIRKEKGISQLGLSKLSGVCKSNIGAIEIGVIKKPSFIDILRIAKALKIEINELYEEVIDTSLLEKRK
ncbi:helix-turn-helix domain-containing protein [Cetobacterium somerae]